MEWPTNTFLRRVFERGALCAAHSRCAAIGSKDSIKTSNLDDSLKLDWRGEVEVNASHVAYMSHPKETARLIEEAATSARNQ